MRILITGASGLLGLNLALEAASQHTVFGLVNRHGLRTKAFTVIQADLLEPGAIQAVLDETQPDWVIHCAALADVDACEMDPQQAAQLNSEVPRKLAHHVARGGARLVHISTDAVFDGERGGYTEDDVPHPLGVYAQTKLAGERLVAQTNPDAIIARVNLFGWSTTGQRSLGEFFFYNLQAGKSIMGFTDVFFCPLLANHLGQILTRMLEARLSGLYHVVSRECLSKYAFGVQLARRFGLDENLIRPVSVHEAVLKAARSPRLTLQTGKLARALGAPLPDLSTGLERFYALYQQGYPQHIKDMSA
ncbi:MAG: SDR family oxidoreductase [Anaerolineales bacterium]